MFGFLKGARQEHKNQIRRMVEEGKTAEQISNLLLIDLAVVKNFVAHYTKKIPHKKETAEQVNEAAETSTEEETEVDTDEPKRKPGRPKRQ